MAKYSDYKAEGDAKYSMWGRELTGTIEIIENLSAARSRIEDADFATETSRFVQQQIMQKAGISVLAQANVQQQAALSLLEGV